MGLLVLIPILAIGYFFLNINILFKYRINHIDGQHLYFKAAATGICIYSTTLIIVSLLSSCFTVIQTILNNFSRYIQHIFFGISELNCYLIILTFLSFFITVSANYLFNKIAKHKLEIEYGTSNPDELDLYLLQENLKSPIDKLLFDSAYSKMTIMVTMSDRKVYIGNVIQDDDLFKRFANKIDDFDFLPLKSGFRDKDSLEVTITTHYKVDPQKPKNNSIIILKKTSIVSCAKIELNLFEQFTRNQDPLINKLINSQANKKTLKIITKDSKLYWAKLSKNSNCDSITKSESIELEIFAIGHKLSLKSKHVFFSELV